MFLLTILALTLLILIVTVVGGIALFGAAGIVVFGDVIVCAGVIGVLIYVLVRKKRRK